MQLAGVDGEPVVLMLKDHCLVYVLCILCIVCTASLSSSLQVMQLAGVDGEQVVLMLKDHCLVYVLYILCIVCTASLSSSLQVMQLAGVDGEQVVLMLEDHQFMEPQFLELINSLLSAGEVPGLYTPEEIEPLLAPLRDTMSEAGFRGTLLSYFASSKWHTVKQTLV